MGSYEYLEEDGGILAGPGRRPVGSSTGKCSLHAREATLFGLQPGLDPVAFLSTEQTDVPASPRGTRRNRLRRHRDSRRHRNAENDARHDQTIEATRSQIDEFFLGHRKHLVVILYHMSILSTIRLPASPGPKAQAASPIRRGNCAVQLP